MNPGRAILESPTESDWLKRAIVKIDELDVPNADVKDVLKLLDYIHYRTFDNGFLSG